MLLIALATKAHIYSYPFIFMFTSQQKVQCENCLKHQHILSDLVIPFFLDEICKCLETISHSF